MMLGGYPKRISGSRCNPVVTVAEVDTACTEIVVDTMIAGTGVEVLEKYIPWVGSCSHSKVEIR